MPILLRQLARRAFAATLPQRWLLVQGGTRRDSACLTFDDGPHPEHTPRVLDVLRKLGVPATFFVVGERAERHPELIRRIVAEGHTLGHHSFTHSDPEKTTAAQLLAEVHRTQTVLEDVAGAALKLFRPPHGKLTVRKALGLWRDGQTVVLWNVDPKDFTRGSANELRDWFQKRPVAGGDIVLFHDNRPHAAAVLPDIVHAARDRGLRFVTPLNWLSRGTVCGE